MSIRGHLLWLVLAAVVPVLAFSAVMMFEVADRQRSAMKEDIRSTADKLALDVDTQLRETISALEVLAVSDALAKDDLAQFHALAKRVLDGRPGWANVTLAGAQGEHLVNLRMPFGTPLPAFNHPEVFVEAARARAPVISDLLPGVIARRALTVVIVPVFRGEQVKYVLAAAIEAVNWERYLQQRLPQHMHATLVDRHRTIVARTLDGERVAGSRPTKTFLDSVGQQAEGGVLRGATLEGIDAYGAYRRSAFSGWTVAAFMRVDAVEAPVRASLARLGVGFLFLLAVSLLLAWVFGRRIASAIAQLTDSVRAVGTGSRPLTVDARIKEVRQASQALENASTLLAERLAREQDMRAQLEAADKAKDDYLAMLGHELRNPLAPMNASLFVLKGEELPSEPARRALAVIGRQVGHLNRLLDDLLDVTRLVSGRVELQMETLDLGELLRQAAEDHSDMASKAQVDLVLRLPSRSVRVEGDPTRLAQIVGNLLLNSLRFTPAGGSIELSLARSGERAEIRVRDTGTGIAPELLPRLFEPFARGTQQSARSRAGLGLGLAVVKGLAGLHGGSVHAVSVGAGNGAEFVVTLPARDAPTGEGK